MKTEIAPMHKKICRVQPPLRKHLMGRDEQDPAQHDKGKSGQQAQTETGGNFRQRWLGGGVMQRR